MQAAKALRKLKEKERRSRNRWKTKQSFKNKVVKQLQTFAPYVVIMIALAGIFLTSQYGSDITGFFTGANESNNAPEWQGRTLFTVETSDTRTINLSEYTYDEDRDELRYSITKDSGIDANLKEELIEIKGDTSTPGEHEIAVRITDGKITIEQRLTIIVLQSIEEVKKKKAETEIETELLTKDEVKTIIVLKQNSTTKDLAAIKENRKQTRESVRGQLTAKGLLNRGSYDVGEIEELNSTSILIAKITKQGLAKLEQNGLVESIFIDRKLTVGLLDSVQLINATNITALGENVTGTILTGKGQTACIVDTGIDNNHEAFAGRITDEKCFCSVTDYGAGGCCANNASTYDIAEDDSITSHGTHIAGIIASNGTIKGVAPEANLVVVKTCDNTGQCAASDVLKAIDYCNEKTSTYNISVISGSFGDGQEYNSTNCPTYIDAVLNTSNSLGISTTFSAGNEYFTKGINYPACSPFAIAVGASTKQNTLADFSNKGETLSVLAPGTQIQSTIKGSYGTKSGTSMSTAHVAGGILLIKERDAIENKTHTPEIIREALKQGGMNISGASWPRIDIGKTISIIDSVIAENITFNGTNETVGNETFHIAGGAAPVITLNTPANASISTITFRDMNITTTDPESDIMNVSIYGDNISATPTELLSFYQNRNNESLTYNWTAPTVLTAFLNDPSLVAYWNFDVNLSDSSGNNNNAQTVVGSHVSNNKSGGKFGGYDHFDGQADPLLVNVSASLNITSGQITTSAWVKVTADADYKIIVSKRVSGTNFPYEFRLTPSEQVEFIYYNAGSRVCTDNNTIVTAGQWTHVAATRNDTENQTRLYVNGVQTKNCTLTQAMTQSNANLIIGDISPYGVNAFNGDIDELAIWNRTLSPSEISRMYSLSNGTYTWYATASDGLSITTSATNKFLVGADTTKPDVSDPRPLLSATNTTGTAIEIAINATDNFALDTVWTNITLPNASITSLTLTATGIGQKFNGTYTIPALAGLYNITFYANDTTNNLNNSITTNFTATAAGGGNNFPTKPTLTDPTNGNITATNRTPILRWSASTDADSDPIMYNVTLECTGTCAPYAQYIKANTTLLNFTINQSLQVDTVYKWNVTADDFVGGSNTSATFNFTVASLVSATLTNTRVDFGALAINVSADTTANNPLPLRIRNDGNVYIDVNLTGDQSPWSTVALNNVNFQTKAGGGGTINSTTSLASFTNIASTTIRVIGQLNFSPDSAINTSAEIELNITVPEAEPVGQKEANMTITVAQTT